MKCATEHRREGESIYPRIHGRRYCERPYFHIWQEPATGPNKNLSD